MTDVDSEAVAKEKQALENVLSYRSVHHDTDLVLDDTDRVMFAEANRAGHGLYGVASEFVLDCYYERGVLGRPRRGRGIQELRAGIRRAGHRLVDQARSPRRGQSADRGAERAAR